MWTKNCSYCGTAKKSGGIRVKGVRYGGRRGGGRVDVNEELKLL